MSVRAFFRAIAIPGSQAPYDRASLKVYYPSSPTDSDEERNTGVVPAATELAPYPIVIMLPGINVGPESYAWLACRLAGSGNVVITYTLVAEEMPGYISLTPGLDIAALTPERYGKNPSATATSPILKELSALNEAGVLQGLLDLDNIVLGGHSAGGTVALLNARGDWVPGLRAVFSYGAHAAAATALGYEPDHLFDLPSKLPVMILGGARDGCIANSAARYSEAKVGSATDKVERTFEHSLSGTRQDSYLAILQGANHFSLAWPHDDTTGRPFIDLPTTRPDEEIRELLAALSCDFVAMATRGDQAAKARLDSALLTPNPLVARGDRR